MFAVAVMTLQIRLDGGRAVSILTVQATALNADCRAANK